MTQEEVSTIIVDLMRGTGKYTMRKITDEDAKLIYKNAMRQCLYILEWYPHLDKCRLEIKCYIDNLNKTYPDKWWKSNHKAREYHMMAFDQTLAIIASIEKRFVSGSCSDPNIHKDRVIAIYDNSVDFD